MPHLRRSESPTVHGPDQRMTWEEICKDDALRGRWVAIADCSYDEATGRATEGLVVDSDDDLAELCSRMRASPWKNCSIVFADAGTPPQRRSSLN